MEISDSLQIEGSTKIITYIDYYIDSINVELSATLTNLGKNSNGDWVVACSISQAIKKLDGDVIAENLNDTVEWVSGFETTTKSDDVYYKTGSGSIAVNDTLKYSRNITSPLLYDRSCGFILSGTEEVYKDSDSVVINYGSGDCDQYALVTTNGITDTINLAKCKFDDNSAMGKSHSKSHHNDHHR